MEHTYFFAVDLGATSGRTILGCLGEGKMELKELTRFPNHIIETGGHCYWDIYALYNEIIRGLKVVAKDNLPIRSSRYRYLGGGFRIRGHPEYQDVKIPTLREVYEALKPTGNDDQCRAENRYFLV